MQTPSHDYRPDVDGLRALAVLPVVIFHASPALIPGGFVGVDIFFIISGYLISGIILKALFKQKFSFLDFYSRRAKRIFPALTVVLLTVAIFGWLLSVPAEFQLLGKHIAAGAGFLLNINLYVDTNPYFGEIGTPLVHLWSLGVEEQFYFFWPVFLWATMRFGRWQLGLIALVIVASFTVNVSAISTNPMRSFFLPTSRLWELALGGALAYIEQSRMISSSSSSSHWPKIFNPQVASTLGLGLLLYSFIAFDMKTPFPGWWALLPCVGATLLIAAGPRGWFNRHVLSLRAVVFVGLISYPLYLWHWPILSFAHNMHWRSYTPVAQTAAVVVSFILAYLTYRFIEHPIRSSPKLRPVAAKLTAVLAGCAMLGYLSFAQYIPARNVPLHISPFVAAATEEYPFPDDHGFMKVGDPTAPKQVLFIGDSTIGQYHSRIDKILSERPGHSHSAVFAWRPGCAPDIGVTRIDKIECQNLLTEARAYAMRPEIDTVVLGFCWYPYFTANRDPDRVGESRPLVPGTKRALENIERMATDFISQGKRVYIVLHAPLDPGYAPLQMVRRTLQAPGFELDIRNPSKEEITQAFRPFINQIREIASQTGARLIDPMESLCDAENCPAVTEFGEPIYRDMFHLRKEYIREKVSFLDETVHITGTAT